jgi:hypothetical protein
MSYKFLGTGPDARHRTRTVASISVVLLNSLNFSL